MNEDAHTVWVFEHEVDYEGVQDMQIFSTREKAEEYPLKNEYYMERFPNIVWIYERYYGYPSVRYNKAAQTLRIYEYTVDCK